MFFPFCIVIVLFTNGIQGGCILSMKYDFGKPSPVYLRNGDFLAPDIKSGDVIMRRAEILQVACPGDGKHVMMSNTSSGLNLVNLKCVKDSTYQSVKPPWVGNLSEVSCNHAPWFSVEETRAKCTGGHNMYRVGYNIENIFRTLYEVCFDKYLVRTLYVKQVLTPTSKYSQAGKRPQFIEGGSDGLFENEKMSKLYSLNSQRQVFDEILGPGMGDKYVTKTQFLSRGHMAPRADFPFHAEKRASFHYINVSPQWQRGNAGDWAALENALRLRVFKHGSPVSVYTGTHGLLTLPDARQVDRGIYMSVDANNNHKVPVPLYFYKVVHDERSRTAVAFVTINSSYYNTTRVDELSFCSDICDQNPQFNWLKWRPRDGTHSFCCTYEDFKSKINDLPKLQVDGLFF